MYKSKKIEMGMFIAEAFFIAGIFLTILQFIIILSTQYNKTFFVECSIMISALSLVALIILGKMAEKLDSKIWRRNNE